MADVLHEDEVLSSVEAALERLASGDRERHGEDYALTLEATARPVAWADAAWARLLPLLSHADNRVRSIAGQTLCRLAPGADKVAVSHDLHRLVAATKDERFVTARHILASLWQVGLADRAVRRDLLDALMQRAGATAAEKNGALVRCDISICLRRLFDETGDEAVRNAALSLIEREPDDKNAQKMRRQWRWILDSGASQGMRFHPAR